jgi:SPX domain protein involved in polyphosphate accumulation
MVEEEFGKVHIVSNNWQSFTKSFVPFILRTHLCFFVKVIRRHGKIQWGCRPTKKKYAFEIDEVPKGESEFLEVVYDYSGTCSVQRRASSCLV